MRRAFLTVLFAALLAESAPAQQFVPAPGADPLHRPFDQILDPNVRDGMVYYRALAASRGALDRYITSLNVPGATYDAWSKPQQMAFWVNAYNAFVLQTVVSHYPLHGTVRSIPGAFDKTAWHAAGRSVTLDQIEKTILPDFKEPRLYLALGRGCIGGGRLRSEAYTAERLEKQLADIQSEFVNNAHMYRLDRLTNTLSVTPIFSWREADFIAVYDAKDPVFAQRSPIERAVVAFVTPHLLPSEKEFIQKNEWKMSFLEMDWKLNDLSGR
ncbi:MAG TPA: DUF547 domain-containing protein [Vicinamibacterales bacterium]|jgi:hypothetical protein|nr:DUF547 domain-containing protein [Vicinamibacterales bacterium]